MLLDPETVDLLALVRALRDELGAPTLMLGYVNGKSLFRDRTVRQLSCSQLEAERIVDTLITRGFARFESSSGTQTEGIWFLQTER